MNWMRLWLPCTEAAMARARAVLPVPGASSSSRCPSESKQVSASRTTGALPSSAWPTLSTIFAKVSANQAACSGVTVIGGPLSLLLALAGDVISRREPGVYEPLLEPALEVAILIDIEAA